MGRGRRKSGLASAFAALVLLAGCGSTVALVDVVPADGVPPPSAAPASTDLPDGWRWEAFRNVEVGVPADWSNTRSDLLTSCQVGAGPGNAVVGRPPFAVDAIACIPAPGRRSDPAKSVETGGRFVAFTQGWQRPAERTVRDRRTVPVTDSVFLEVQAEPELRDQIIATIRVVDEDANGCPVQDAVVTEPWTAPEPAVAVGSLTGVRSVSACHYDLDERGTGRSGLASSVRLNGERAADAIRAIADAPQAGGQDEPTNCASGHQLGYGWAMVVLRVLSDQGLSKIHLRYAGCDHNGIDDGVQARRLVVDAVQPFVQGPREFGGFSSGDGKSEALRPDSLRAPR